MDGLLEVLWFLVCLKEEMGIRFIDWIDYFYVCDVVGFDVEFWENGFLVEDYGDVVIWCCESGFFLVICVGEIECEWVVIKVELIVDFLFVN